MGALNDTKGANLVRKSHNSGPPRIITISNIGLLRCNAKGVYVMGEEIARTCRFHVQKTKEKNFRILREYLRDILGGLASQAEAHMKERHLHLAIY